MSIFSPERDEAPPFPRTAAKHWWNWNPARPKPLSAPLVAEPARWWSWNPYRNTVNRAAAQGRREGYDKGVHDEQRIVQRRRRRRSHPIMSLLFFAAAVGGVGFVGLAFDTGSFAAGGAVVDQKIAEWRSDIANGGTNQGATSSTSVTQTSSQSGG